MSNLTHYRCLVRAQTGNEAFYQNYWAYAEHIGAAVDKITEAAIANGVTTPEPRELDPFNVDNLQCKVAPHASAEVFWSVSKAFFEPEPIFRLPYGIIASGTEGESDVEDITAGYKRQKDDKGMTTLEINVARSDLLSLYELLLNAHPVYKVFWYLLHDHWDHAADKFLVNESLNAPGQIISHIRTNEYDSLKNGYVTLTSYHEEGATNVNISDHKRITIFTHSDDIAHAYAQTLRLAGYPETSELVSIDCRIHHWHYRSSDSRAREELITYLRQSGFLDWSPKP